MAEIVINKMRKVFENGFCAVDDVDLTISDGEFVVLVGPSGCGKTTLLRMIAGLEEPTSGRIVMDGRDVTDSSPRERDVAFVFQNYALYPHMTVRRNLGYGLRVRKVPKADTERRTSAVAELLQLGDLLDRRPAGLSGGQRQRVAMGRAMVREPVAFLMDEPLSNLDAKLRVAMRAELTQLHQRLGVTTVYVTHDQVEAMTLGQRVAVMRDGAIQQIAPPQTLYTDPTSVFVAAFIGSPSMNLVLARLEEGAVCFGSWRVPARITVSRPSIRAGAVILGIRPEAFEDVEVAPAGMPTIEIDVEVVEELGPDTYVYFSIDAPPVDLADLKAAADGEEQTLLVRERALLHARVDPRTRARAGSRLRLALDPERFYLFDAEDGSALSTPAVAAAAHATPNA